MQLKLLKVFHAFAQNLVWVHIEPPRRGSFNEYPQSVFWVKTKKKYKIPFYIPLLLYRIGVQGVSFSWTCFFFFSDEDENFTTGSYVFVCVGFDQGGLT